MMTGTPTKLRGTTEWYKVRGSRAVWHLAGRECGLIDPVIIKAKQFHKAPKAACLVCIKKRPYGVL